jgi:hypothetical protein
MPDFHVGAAQTYATPQLAWDAMPSGDWTGLGAHRMIVHAGTYNGALNLDSMNPTMNATDRLVIEASPGDTVTWNNGAGSNCVSRSGTTTAPAFYVTINGVGITFNGSTDTKGTVYLNRVHEAIINGGKYENTVGSNDAALWLLGRHHNDTVPDRKTVLRIRNAWVGPTSSTWGCGFWNNSGDPSYMDALIENSHFEGIFGCAMFLMGNTGAFGQAVVRNCAFKDTSWGVRDTSHGLIGVRAYRQLDADARQLIADIHDCTFQNSGQNGRAVLYMSRVAAAESIPLNITFRNNRVFQARSGVKGFAQVNPNFGPTTIDIRNNTLDGVGSAAICVSIGNNVADSWTVRNNILRNWLTGINKGTGGLTENNNDFHLCTTNAVGFTPDATDLLDTDPLLVDPATYDYHLQRPASPCIDAGVNVGDGDDIGWDQDVESAGVSIPRRGYW